MELKEYLNKYEIVGVVSNYQSKKLNKEFVKDLDIKNIQKALKMVGLDDEVINKKISDLTLSEELKIDLASKLNEDVIVIGNLSNRLIYKDIEYLKKLLLKLNNDYHKKIVIIDNDINVFIGLVKHICVMKNKNMVYSTSNFYDDKLYEYVRMPRIIEFVKYVNKDNKRIEFTTDIYELIKDIYRRIS